MARTVTPHSDVEQSHATGPCSRLVRSPRDQGWVSITKPKEVKLLKRGEESNLEIGMSLANNSNNRTSSSSPKEASCYSCFRSPLQSAEQRPNCLQEKSKEISNNSWLVERIRQCDEQAGVTVYSYEEGWDSVFHFTEDKDAQFRTAMDLELDKKSSKRESTNPSCSITYERSRRRKGLKAGKTDSKLNELS